MERRVNLLVWISEMIPNCLPEGSLEREDYFDFGILESSVLNAIYATLKTARETEGAHIRDLLNKITNDPPLKATGTILPGRSTDLLVKGVSAARPPKPKS